MANSQLGTLQGLAARFGGNTLANTVQQYPKVTNVDLDAINSYLDSVGSDSRNIPEGLAYQTVKPLQNISTQEASIPTQTNNNTDYFSKLYEIESSNNPKARAGSHYGLAQFGESTAKPYLEKIGKTWNDYLSDENVQRTLAKMHDETNIAGLKRAGIEPTARNRYLAHQQGLTGAINLLKHGKYNPKALASNLPSEYNADLPTFLNYWDEKWKGVQ